MSASKFVDECEDDEIKTSYMNVDGILANFLNVRGYDDPQALADMVAEGKAERTSQNDGSEDTTTSTSVSPQEFQEHRRLEDERIRQEVPPERDFHHVLFVRITRKESNEILGQGFCRYSQLMEWHAGIDMYSMMVLLLDVGLKESPEYQTFADSNFTRTDAILSNLRYIVIAFDLRTSDKHCLFQSDGPIKRELTV